MIEHLGNCHGEWTFLGSLLLSLPLIGTWWRARKARKAASNCPCGHDDGSKHA